MKSVVSFIILLSSAGAMAFIPSTQFIFNRLTAVHGKGTYHIEQEVSFREGIDSFVAKESWLIRDGGDMRVEAVGDGFRVFRILKNARVFSVDENGNEVSESAPAG